LYFSYDEDETKKEEEAPFVNLEVDLKQLKTIGVLGRGSFGYVKLVEHMVTGETYALKAVNKTDIVATGQQVHIMNEKKVMMDMNHPFLVKLHGTFKDAV
jgi:serine/threonine protein kinase